MDNFARLTYENVEAFIIGLQRGDTQKKIAEDIGISEATLSIWKRRAFGDEPLTKKDLPLQPLRDFLIRGFNRKPEQGRVRAALIEAVTTDRVTTTEKVTEIVKLTSSQREALAADLTSAFDAGEAVLVQKVTTTKTENPNLTAIIEAYHILFPDDEDSAGNKD